MDYREYRDKLNSYEQRIQEFSLKIEEAKKNLIVSQTRIESYEDEIKKLTDSCIQKYGVEPDRLSELIQKNMSELDKIVMQIQEIQNAQAAVTQQEVSEEVY